MRRPNVTLRDVANLASVSYATASRALTGSGRVAAQTRQRIQEIATELGYTPNAAARSLVKARTNNIGMIIPDAMNPFYSEVVKGLRRHANAAGFNIFLCDTDGDLRKEAKFVKDLYSQQAAGIVLQPVSDNLSHVFDYYPPDGPLVFLSFKPSFPQCRYVESDQFSLGYLATQHLIRLGHREIYFMGYDYNHTTTVRRYNGYVEAMHKAGLSTITNSREEIDKTQSVDIMGYELARTLLLSDDLPSAIVVYNDLMALGVIASIEDFGLTVPDDISVVGMDDIYLAGLPRVNLTTVGQEKTALGEWCSRILIAAIEDRNEDTPRYQVLRPYLVVRKTTRAWKPLEQT